MTSAPDPMLGFVLDGRYQVRARIARGGMATIYRATDTRLDRDVALKIMHPHLADKDEFVTRFHQEARSAAKLAGPNVVSVYDQGMFTGGHYTTPTAYLVMEYISGPDLRTELARRGSFPLADALSIVIDILGALGSAHRAGIVHRDVKPENVLLSPEAGEMVPKVTDFGLARAIASVSTTSAGHVLGTVAYLAPEVMSGEVTERSDVYAAGIMLYELIAGHVPFSAETPIALAYKHVNENMPRLSAEAPWIPPAVDSLIGLLTAKDPLQRPVDGATARARAVDVLDEIDDVVGRRRVPVLSRKQLSLDEPRSPSGIIERRPSGRHRTESGDLRTSSLNPPSRTSRLANPPAMSAREQRASERGARRAEKRAVKRQQSAAVKPRSNLWRWALVVVLAVFAALGAGWYFLIGPGARVQLPDVTAYSEADARERLVDVGLDPVFTREYSDDIAAGHVIRTDPSVPATLERDTPVTVTISRGVEQTEVPDLAGLTEEEAREALREARLSPSITYEWSTEIDQGYVISQGETAGSRIDHSSSVDVSISRGPEPISVPAVIGEMNEDAREVLTNAGFDVRAELVWSDTIPRGTVIDQNPQAFATSHRGETITLTVSRGPKLHRVPDVVGMDQRDARVLLEDLGFDVKEDSFIVFFNEVTDQSLEPGSLHPEGTEIVLRVR